MLLINSHYKINNAWFYYITEITVFSLEFLWVMKYLIVMHADILRAYKIVCFHNYSICTNIYIFIYT